MITGSCHCGLVVWEFNVVPASATACNCTVCRRYGVLWSYGSVDKSIKLSGPTSVYQPANYLGLHFCGSCGCLAFWRALSPGDNGLHRAAVNLRLAEPAAIASIPVRHFDGLDTFTELPGDDRCVADYWI